MGSPADEEGRNRDEELYEVTLTQPYYLGMTPVTQTQYGQVMGGNPSFFQAEKLEGCNSNHPVEQVSWDDAVAFCVRLSESAEEKAAGRVYRLPTEAEWEYACRLGCEAAYSLEERSEALGLYARLEEKSNRQTQPVGQRKPKASGFFDMHGNIWEWCFDRYGCYPARKISDPAGPSEGTFRVNRGGNFSNFGAALCRPAARYWAVPSTRYRLLGFRLALSPPRIPI